MSEIASEIAVENQVIQTPSSKSSTFSDFLSFRKMITPIVLQVVFWIMVASIVLMGIGMMGNPRDFGLPRDAGIVGFLVLVIGPFIIRMIFELIILSFRINETLTDIRNSLRK